MKTKPIIDTLVKTKADIVAFQETKKEELSSAFLNSISKVFEWHHLPAIGSAGGILMGVDVDIFDILAWDSKNFSVSCTLTLKATQKTFRVVAVYGSPYDEGKDDLISELHTLLLDSDTPTLIGGDFNLTRYQRDKNNGRVDQRWCAKFNAWVEIWSLLEIKMSGWQFT